MGGEAPLVLVVGGHDSSGGAGVDADREALEAAGVRGAVVVSAWTVQDASGVRELGAVPPSDWLEEARVRLDAPIAALKFGLLPGVPAIGAARELVTLAGGCPVVLDPVLASSSGTRFHGPRGLAALRAELFPLGLIWTPNVPELAELCERDPESLGQGRQMVRFCREQELPHPVLRETSYRDIGEDAAESNRQQQ